MTNGEKFKEVFKISQVDEGQLYAFAWLPNHDAAEISIDWWNSEYKESTKNDLGVDCIDKTELLKAMDTWDKFGDDPNEGLILLSTPTLQDRYVPYVKYDDMVNCVKGMPSVTPQEPTIDYRRTFKIACELLSGSVLYGIDSDKIFETAMQKDGLVSNESYERYILNHLQELDHGQYEVVEE